MGRSPRAVDSDSKHRAHSQGRPHRVTVLAREQSKRSVSAREVPGVREVIRAVLVLACAAMWAACLLRVTPACSTYGPNHERPGVTCVQREEVWR